MKIYKSTFRFLLISASILLATTSTAEVVIHGMIREKDKSLSIYDYPYYHDNYTGNDKNYFPRKYYHYIIYAYDLKYDDNVPLKDRKYDLKDYRGNISAELHLISTNQNTQTYTFKLVMNNPSLDYIGAPNDYRWMQGGVSMKGKIKLSNGLSPEFLIKVRVGKDERGRLTLINLKNNKFFQLNDVVLGKSAHSTYLRPQLTRRYDFPVILEGAYEYWSRIQTT